MEIPTVQKLLYGVLTLIALLLVIGFALPRTQRVEVSTEIDAHAATVFALINDLRRYSLWSPLFETDPQVRVRYSGSEQGVGATMSWDGVIAGSGIETIVESRPFSTVALLLNPGEPGEAVSRFELTRGNGTTIVTRSFEADTGMNVVARYFAAMLGSVIARDYANGLANLKEVAESLPRTDFSDLDIERVIVEARNIAYITVTSRPEPAAISAAMSNAYFQILNFIDAQKLAVAGPPLSITRAFNGATLVFDAAIPVAGTTDATPQSGPTVGIQTSYEGPAIRATHTGPYGALKETHRKIVAYLAAYGMERNGDAWESYVSDPAETADEDLLTYVYYPIKPLSMSANQMDLMRNGGTREDSSSLRDSPTTLSSRTLESSLNSATTCVAHSLASSGDILRTDAQTGLSPFSGATRYMDCRRSENACLAETGRSSSSISPRFSS